MIRHLALALALVVASLLPACAPNPNIPQRMCAAWGPPYPTRYGSTRDCVEYVLGCVKPLVLDEKADGTLFCRLRRDTDPS
jgi:hypothetical protein